MRPRFHFPVLDHQTETEWLTQMLGGTLMFIQVRTCSKHNRWNSTHSSSNSPSQKKERTKTGFTTKIQLHLPRVCSIKSLWAHWRISFCLETKSSGVAGCWVSHIKRKSFWYFSFDQIRRHPYKVSNPTWKMAFHNHLLSGISSCSILPSEFGSAQKKKSFFLGASSETFGELRRNL